jgi:hypothetical protein
MLRVVDAVPTEPPEPIPLDALARIVNTIRCQTAFCGVPLCGLTKKRRVIRLHGAIDEVSHAPDATTIVATCPNCHTQRTVTVR